MLDLPPQVFNAWTCDHLWFLAELCSDILECSAPPPPPPSHAHRPHLQLRPHLVACGWGWLSQCLQCWQAGVLNQVLRAAARRALPCLLPLNPRQRRCMQSTGRLGGYTASDSAQQLQQRCSSVQRLGGWRQLLCTRCRRHVRQHCSCSSPSCPRRQLPWRRLPSCLQRDRGSSLCACAAPRTSPCKPHCDLARSQ